MSIMPKINTGRTHRLFIELNDVEKSLWDELFANRKAEAEAVIGAPRFTQHQLLAEMMVLFNEKMQTK